MIRLRLPLFLLFLFVSSVLMVACSSIADTQTGTTVPSTATVATHQAGSTGTPTPYHTGEQVSVGPWMITLQTYSSTGDSSYTPKAGHALLVVTVRQQNQNSQPATENGAADWSLRDSLGTTFPLVTQSGYGTFPPASVAANETATGTLVYEVPTGTQHFLLTFAPATDSHQASWDVSLSAPANSTSSNTQHHNVGEMVLVGPWMITIEVYSSTGDTSYTPKVGDILLVFTVRQQNQSGQSATANGAVDWSLRDSSGTTFPLVTQSGYGTFPPASVAVSETATGTLVYEVPTGTQHFLLTFAPATDSHQASWDVSPD